MKTESEFRSAVVREALTWLGTPYHVTGGVKGAGVNCAMFLYCVARDSGAIAADAPQPRWFTSQLAMHSKEERLLEYVKLYGGIEISAAEVRPGDLVAYRSGSAHGHLALVVEWPQIVHVLPPGGCQLGAVDEGRLGAFPRKYFTLWKRD